MIPHSVPALPWSHWHGRMVYHCRRREPIGVGVPYSDDMTRIYVPSTLVALSPLGNRGALLAPDPRTASPRTP